MTDLFVSYAHADDNHGHVRAMVTAIEEEFQAFGGRPLNVFFDRQAIHSMQDWQARILTSLKQARVMLAVLSPSYLASAYCRKEWQVFLEHEIHRSMLEEGAIAALHYVTVPGLLEGNDPPTSVEIAQWLRDLSSRQIDDVRHWREGGGLTLQREDVRRRLNE